MTFNQLLDKYRAISFSEHDKGSRFELLMKNFLLTYHEYFGKFSDVWLWNDFPFRNDFGGKDVGIDIVAKTFSGQKFYARLWISTSDNITDNVEKLFPNGKILFLVPSISLLWQILHEWTTFAAKSFNYICVCSYETVSKKNDDEIISVLTSKSWRKSK